MHDDSPDLIIFDCDGVLIDSEMLSSAVLIEELAKIDLMIDTGYVRRNFIGRSFATVAQTIRDQFGCTLPDGFEAIYRNTLLERFETELKPTVGIERLLAHLLTRKCVATSSSRPRVTRSLAITGLGRFFGDDVFTASQVAHGKPAPDLFLHAAQHMGADPARILVIEDSLPGLAAGHAAGMRVLRYTGAQHLKDIARGEAGTTASFDSWDEFAQMSGAVIEQKGL